MARSTPPSDTDLALRLKAQDMTALSLLIDRYQAPLTRYVSYLGCNEPEDSVQETFIKLYQNINSYNPTKKFSTWLYRIAHNTAVSHLRSRHFTLPFAEYLDTWVSQGSEVELDFDQTNVKNCLKKLPPHYREVLVLYYFEDKSYTEIMDILRLPQGTVAARINRAKKLLKDICQKQK